MHISKEVGISWTDIDSPKMEISQDFKAAWLWFILHKIGENIKNFPGCVLSESHTNSDRATRLLGLSEESTLKKAIGFMPKLDGAHIKIRGDIGFFSAELGGDFNKSGDQGEVTLDTLSKKIIKILCSLKFASPIFLYFDELEAFYHTPDQHRRDQRMVRDLLFAVDTANTAFRLSGSPLHILAAVRSEVVDSMGSLGQEVDRLVHDRGFHISWHHANRSLNHPLIQIVKQKILSSEKSRRPSNFT